jgi:hypothetical protein
VDVAAGLGVRMPCTFLVMFGSRFNWLEKLFFAIAWSPKVRPPSPKCVCQGAQELYQGLQETVLVAVPLDTSRLCLLGLLPNEFNQV